MDKEFPWQDDEIVFAEESHEEAEITDTEKWKIIISDDDTEIHKVTKMVLANTIYKGKGVEFLDAYSGIDTINIIKKHPDAALLLLDVVMEEDDTGLKIIHTIREDLKNNLIRIIIRTGQPGEAPEKRVILDYDINDYKEKTELTSQKLFSTIISSLRTYDSLRAFDHNQKGIEQILVASNLIISLNSVNHFLKEMLNQIKKLFTININAADCSISGFIAMYEADTYSIVYGLGRYRENDQINVNELISGFNTILLPNTFYFNHNICLGKFYNFSGSHFLIFITKENTISDAEKKLLNILSTNIVSAYNKLFLNNEIENTQKEIFFRLGEVVETRSNETGNHVKRIAEYCYLLGIKYGLDYEEVEILKQAAPMHDIGKVGILDAILNKPGPLSKKEFEIMKRHAIIGYDIFKNSERRILKAAAIIALQHHEHYDGKGYPFGLSGEEIHIFGRITCLADVFDALGSTRIYKKAWNLNAILDYIKANRGTMFDPVLVDIFFNNIDEIIKIRQSLMDSLSN